MIIEGDKNIVWLASYPKSGNTWVRAFLTALINNNQKLDINNLISSYSHLDSRFFEHATGLNASELHMWEIDDLKSEVFEYFSNKKKDNFYVKIHEKFRYLNGIPLIPLNKTLGLIYLVRNPLDVCVSYAYHDDTMIDVIIDRMIDNNYTLSNSKNPTFFSIPEIMGSWDGHITSWLDNNEEINKIVLRYEDMCLEPLKTFSKVVHGINLKYSSIEIEKAIDQSSFNKLRQQELAGVFREKNPLSKSFFRKGKIGTWKEKLNKNQIKRIINNHHDLMLRFGYLTQSGEPIF